MIYVANKKKPHPLCGMACVSLTCDYSSSSWTYLGHILDKTRGTRESFALRAPKTYVFSQGPF